MKANRVARGRCHLGADERGVSEVVGYMIAFGMSSMILVLSLTAFNMMRDYSGDLVADRTVKEVGQRVAFAVDEAMQAGSEFPESEFTRTLRLPKEVNGHTYSVVLGSDNVWVNSTDPGPASRDEAGNDLETLGRANVSLVPRAKVSVICSPGGDDLQNGTCSIHSSDGEVDVRFGRPDPVGQPALRGVYFVRR